MTLKLDRLTDEDHRFMDHADRLVEWFRVVLDETPIEIDPAAADEIVGPAHLNCKAAAEKFPGVSGWDNVHFPMGFEQLLGLGLPGIAERARWNAENVSGREAHYLLSIATAYEAACDFCRRWGTEAESLAADFSGDARDRLLLIAETGAALSEGKPQTFLQAVQLIWFGLAMRNGPSFSPLGRWDLYLYPFYAADRDAGLQTPAKAQALIDELFTKVDSIGWGDGLMNLMLSGVDREGNDVTNDLTFMMMDTGRRLKIACPQVNIRLHKNSPEELRRKVTELQLGATAKGTIFNDDVVIPMLVSTGMPLEMARHYSCDGCNEIVIDGESLVDFCAVDATKSLELMLFNGRDVDLEEGTVLRANYHYRNDHPPEVSSRATRGHETGDFAKMNSFEEVLEAFIDQFLYQAEQVLNRFCEGIHHSWADGVTPPFLAGSFSTCLESGKDPLRGGSKWRSFMLFSGSIPTVADSLAAVKKVIFEDRICTAEELLQALTDDWEGHERLRQRFLAAPKFGNDDDYVDSIDVEIVRRFSDFVYGYDGQL